jgi:hypothetical protein
VYVFDEIFFYGPVLAFTGSLPVTGDFVRLFDHPGEQRALNAGDEGERDNDGHLLPVL